MAVLHNVVTPHPSVSIGLSGTPVLSSLWLVDIERVCYLLLPWLQQSSLEASAHRANASLKMAAIT